MEVAGEMLLTASNSADRIPQPDGSHLYLFSIHHFLEIFLRFYSWGEKEDDLMHSEALTGGYRAEGISLYSFYSGDSDSCTGSAGSISVNG